MCRLVESRTEPGVCAALTGCCDGPGLRLAAVEHRRRSIMEVGESVKPKPVNLVAFMASAAVIAAGFFAALVVILTFADSRKVGWYLTLLALTFGAILLIPLNALRVPRDPGLKVPRKRRKGSWMFS